MKVTIPASLDVGGVTYRIRWDDAARHHMACNGNNGECNRQELLIELNAQMARSEQTLVHELVHAINFEYCADGLCEAQVDSIAHGVLQILRQLGIEFVFEV